MSPTDLICTALVFSVLATPLTVFVLLRFGVVGGQPHDVAIRHLEQEERRLKLTEEASKLQREKHELDMALKREEHEARLPFERAKRSAQGFGPRNLER